jgi:glycosyltransferase involved in cell wall biosynthesis
MGKVEATTVLFIQGITQIGGAERELLVIVDRFPRCGFRPLVVCSGTGPLTEELAKRGVEVRFAPMPPWRKLFSYPRRAGAVRALREAILAVRPGLLHVNDIWWVPQTLRAVAGVRIPIVAHVRQEIEPPKVRRYELDKVDLVLPMSSQIRQSLEKGGVLPERLKVLHSGVDLGAVPDHEDGREIRRRFDIPVDALVLGTVANLFARKGYDVMLRALPEIVATFPQVHYLIVGTGDVDYETRLRTMVRDLELESRVHFAGFQESVYPCLAAMDLYVHPALMEGFGIAVLEAMAMRKPVVATTAGGLPEVAQDGDTGILVPPGDPDALARAVLLLLQDPARCRKLGEAGRDRVAALFTVDAMMDNLAAGYRALLGNVVRVQQAVTG